MKLKKVDSFGLLIANLLIVTCTVCNDDDVLYEGKEFLVTWQIGNEGWAIATKATQFCKRIKVKKFTELTDFFVECFQCCSGKYACKYHRRNGKGECECWTSPYDNPTELAELKAKKKREQLNSWKMRQFLVDLNTVDAPHRFHHMPPEDIFIKYEGCRRVWTEYEGSDDKEKCGNCCLGHGYPAYYTYQRSKTAPKGCLCYANKAGVPVDPEEIESAVAPTVYVPEDPLNENYGNFNQDFVSQAGAVSSHNIPDLNYDPASSGYVPGYPSYENYGNYNQDFVSQAGAVSSHNIPNINYDPAPSGYVPGYPSYENYGNFNQGFVGQSGASGSHYVDTNLPSFDQDEVNWLNRAMGGGGAGSSNPDPNYNPASSGYQGGGSSSHNEQGSSSSKKKWWRL